MSDITKQTHPNFSEKVHRSMELWGFTEAAKEYKKSPGLFANKKVLEAAWENIRA